MNPQRLDIVAANLCGCVIEQIHQQEQRITVELTDPRLGAMALTCEEATLLPLHVEPAAGVECKQLKGIIDWVDVCRGNPGIDLSLLWSLVPRDMFDSFLAEYGKIEEESLLVARVLALGLNAVLANYARDIGHAAVEREARAGIDRALAD